MLQISLQLARHFCLVSVALLLLANSIGIAQVGPKKPVPAAPGFVCPDPGATKACKSYTELRQAGDDGVRASVVNNGIAFACFRQPEDEFFVITLTGPSFVKPHVEPKSKKIGPEDDANEIQV